MMKTIRRLLLVSFTVLLAGCALFGKHEPETTLAIYEQADPALPPTRVRQVEVPKTGLTIPIDPFPLLTEKSLLSAEFQKTALGAAIYLQFDIHGLMVLQEATTRQRGEHMVAFLNGRPVSAWLVERQIDNGQLLLEGDFGEEEAKQAVNAFNVIGKKNQAQ
jgi:preprotein translocase subunit SecD